MTTFCVHCCQTQNVAKATLCSPEGWGGLDATVFDMCRRSRFYQRGRGSRAHALFRQQGGSVSLHGQVFCLQGWNDKPVKESLPAVWPMKLRVLFMIMSSIPAYAQSDAGDARLISRPNAHQGFVRSVADMSCRDTGFGDYLCYKDIGGIILTVQSTALDASMSRSATARFRSQCGGKDALKLDACRKKATFQVGKVSEEKLRLSEGAPLTKRVLIEAGEILLEP